MCRSVSFVYIYFYCIFSLHHFSRPFLIILCVFFSVRHHISSPLLHTSVCFSISHFFSVCLRIMITSSIDLARFDRANKYDNWQ